MREERLISSKEKLISSEARGFPEGKYIFGIPTRSDVKDPRYKKAVMLEELNEKIVPFRNWPDPTEFRKSADPSKALDFCLGEVSRYREAILEAEPYLSHLKRNDYFIERSRRIRNLPVRVTEELIKNFFQKKSRWKYTFNPWELLTGELDSLETDFKVAVESKKTPVRKIRKLNLAIKTHKESPVKDLVEFALKIDIPKSPFEFENDHKTEAGRLYQINEKIAEKSDMYLRFDEFYLVVKEKDGFTNLPFENIFSPEYRFTLYSLRHRTLVRDFIAEKLGVENKIVFNGATLKEENGKMVSDIEVPLWVVNLFAKPILAKGRIIELEEWAVKEKEMVDNYRALTIAETRQISHPIIGRILNSYTDEETETDKKKLDNLLYYLREGDWDTIHKIR